ncbi:MAG TPA: hypothetical protein VKP69_00525 [Isosphaeraceae bacterium]|nr:hypothetical protein [Isosphaeraceae bacterium]
MSANLAQSLSLAGALLVLLGYGGNQYAGLRSDGLPYGLLNLVGSTLLAVPAFQPLNLGVLVLESAWALISLGIVVRALGRKPTASPPPAA